MRLFGWELRRTDDDTPRQVGAVRIDCVVRFPDGRAERMTPLACSPAMMALEWARTGVFQVSIPTATETRTIENFLLSIYPAEPEA